MLGPASRDPGAPPTLSAHEAACAREARRLSSEGEKAYGLERHAEAISFYSAALAAFRGDLEQAAESRPGVTPISADAGEGGEWAAGLRLDPELCAVVLVNRSLCWSKLATQQAPPIGLGPAACLEAAVADAEAAAQVRPRWARAHYRHGVSLWNRHATDIPLGQSTPRAAGAAAPGSVSAGDRAALRAAYSAVELATRLQGAEPAFTRKKRLLAS